MNAAKPTFLADRPDLRDRGGCFRDRAHGAEVLVELLEAKRPERGIVLAIPAGGVPVAEIVAVRLDLPLDVMAVSKITFAQDPESGFGAVAFDGTVRMSPEAEELGWVTRAEIAEGIDRTLRKVRRRNESLRGKTPFPDLAGRTAILVDDGIASGLTIRVAAECARKAGAARVVAAAPTAHRESVLALQDVADAAVCPNVRSGRLFAVADAYLEWSDVGEDEARAILESRRPLRQAARSE